MRSGIVGLFILAVMMDGCANSNLSKTDREKSEQASLAIQTYRAGMSAILSANSEVKLTIDRDPMLSNGLALFVEYPAGTGNPAGRDVWLDVENENWTSGRAISFAIKPEHEMRLSVSFQDRNRVAYTSWQELKAAVWQTVRIPFDQLRPNPYFQPPGANVGAPLDVGEVHRIGFAPQEQAAGRMAIGKFIVTD